MFLLIPIILGNSEFVNITKFDSHPGIYFDGLGQINIVKDKWHLWTYFNMSGYWSQADEFEKISHQVKSLCQLSHCKNNMDVIQTQIQDIQELNELILEECHLRELVRAQKINRNRRSYQAPLNVIGMLILHSVYLTAIMHPTWKM